ncbi:sulfite exporter TauE/SafE family protein [Aestuariirhabdus sp. Z084]|uniref:sulfite exporter TauE/SafE family protein n=1 Tax=Aestuariirhabdus haliotis TaxID=2918751 RepID=UPI00201B42F1|nr:sulfite exporter TauE/SafE family protein [Aestuariirhabdus haliotis]MCL6414089.1 sulfite exporter TauE/SafE family protein [Aestuariirhabdus haliotis]MCL6418021.1 sulfite exporter TauE/SafE family protein [Aestuariirhabdus haliotis]
MENFETLILIVMTFLLAGTVKGVIGLGLPTVSLALLTVAIDLPSAMALLVVPSLLTNLWQGVAGAHNRQILRQLWPFFTMAVLTVGLGAQALSQVDHRVLTSLLGLLLVLYALINLAGVSVRIGPLKQRWLGPLLGIINGVLTGMTGSFVVPGVFYLQAIGLSRDALIQAMGWLFFLSTLALALSLQVGGRFSAELGMQSAIGLLPAIAGMLLGQRIRRRLSPERFRRLFFTALLLLGAYLLL